MLIVPTWEPFFDRPQIRKIWKVARCLSVKLARPFRLTRAVSGGIVSQSLCVNTPNIFWLYFHVFGFCELMLQLFIAHKSLPPIWTYLHGVVLHFLVFTFLTVRLLVHLWLAASDLLTASRTIEFLLTSGGPGSKMHHDESSWLQTPVCHTQLCTGCTWAQRCPPSLHLHLILFQALASHRWHHASLLFLSR